ncbi:MAG: hypothetical protein EBX97_08065 [Actinobacteria bacterium]|nr:hypothetical protein [Actinomycetota bacterium]
MKVIVKNVNDASGKKVEVACENGRIIDLGKVTPDFQQLDGGGLTIIPGLVDLHTHLLILYSILYG